MTSGVNFMSRILECSDIQVRPEIFSVELKPLNILAFIVPHPKLEAVMMPIYDTRIITRLSRGAILGI